MTPVVNMIAHLALLSLGAAMRSPVPRTYAETREARPVLRAIDDSDGFLAADEAALAHGKTGCDPSCPNLQAKESDIGRFAVAAADCLNKTTSSLGQKSTWFLIEGTLIAALRFGKMTGQLKSGKLNLVDQDFDFAIVCPNCLQKKGVILNMIVQCLSPQFPGTTADTKKFGAEPGIENIKAPATTFKPDKCIGKANYGHTWIDLHFMSVGSQENGHGILAHDKCVTLDKPTKRSLDEWTRGVYMPGYNELIHPIQRAKWYGGTANVPHKYLHFVRTWNNHEYQCDSEIKCWRPAYLRSVGCDTNGQCCRPTAEDLNDIRASILSLDQGGFASFTGMLD